MFENCYMKSTGSLHVGRNVVSNQKARYWNENINTG